MADKKISELDLTLQINNDAVFPMSQENAGEPTTFKAAITQLGTKIAEDMTFSNLQTTSKTLVGAINELLSLGSPIIIGTTAPTSSQGADGNIYVQYTEGTGGADDEVDGIYVKIDGAWCEIETGGGGGTTDYEDLSNKPQVNSVELVGNKSLDDLGIMPASLSKTVSGSIAHITDGADNIPVKSLVSQIVAVESGNGQPKSPDNPYTISGFASGIITVTDNDQITNTYTFAFGQTVYGGHFDNKGNLTIDFANDRLDSKSWTYNSGRGAFNTIFSGKDQTRFNKMICSCYANGGQVYSASDIASKPDKAFYTQANSDTVFIKDSDYTDPTTWLNALGSNTLCYPLTTPTTLSITSQDIPTLLGENNIFSNCGDVEVTYYTDNADEIVEVSKATASTPLHHYSEDEHIVGTWVDGSTLYEKTIYNVGGTSGEINIQHGVSNLDKIVYAEGVCADSGATPYNYYPFSRISNDGYNIGISVATTSMVSVYIPSAFQQRIVDIYVTIRYTKTA